MIQINETIITKNTYKLALVEDNPHYNATNRDRDAMYTVVRLATEEDLIENGYIKASKQHR